MAIVCSIFIVLSLILTLDTYNFYTVIQTADGTGVGLHLFLGLVEVNDRIPTQMAGGYFANLREITMMSWAITLIVCALSLGIYWYTHHRKQKQH